MTYTRGDNRRLIHALALENGWTLQSPVWSDTEIWERRESNITLIWTPRDTLTHSSISLSGQGRYPAPPRMGLVKARDWLSAPGELTHTVKYRHADFIECACGHLSVNDVDHRSHEQEMDR